VSDKLTINNNLKKTIMKTIYSAICFAPDGEYVRDFYSDSKESISKEIENMSSRWFFYPFVFIATEKTIVEAPNCLEFLNGKRVKTVEQFFRENEDIETYLRS
jgi:hypothetical protein